MKRSEQTKRITDHLSVYPNRILDRAHRGVVRNDIIGIHILQTWVFWLSAMLSRQKTMLIIYFF